MFTIEQIKSANEKVNSGADFPKYIQEIIKLGVTRFEAFVADGHVLYYGKDGFELMSDAWYGQLIITEKSDKVQFKKELKAHQQGYTDYLTFCRFCANLGIEKWLVDMAKMTCTYYDLKGNEVLAEMIPTPFQSAKQ